MSDHSKQISEMIKSGTYYEEARAWYGVKYIGPVPERTFFLILAGLAGLVGFLAFIAVMAFLPLTERKAILISSKRIDETVPNLVQLRAKGQPMNIALMNFYLESYVAKRESYEDSTYDANYAFIRAQSDSATFNDYTARYDRNAKQSPAAALGRIGKRVVNVKSIVIDNMAEPKTATVKFSTDVLGYQTPLHADWTAVLQFYYTDLVVTETKDAETGEIILKTQDPQFQVVHYALSQTL